MVEAQEPRYVYLVYAWKQGGVPEARMATLNQDEALYHAQRMVQAPGDRSSVDQWVLGAVGLGLPVVMVADVYWSGEQPVQYGGGGGGDENPWTNSNFGRPL